jgi:hypothetical protein
VLEFDDNNVDCERDVEIVVYGCKGGVGIEGGGSGSGNSKISTTSENPLELFPPPKNILFVDDVDAR